MQSRSHSPVERARPLLGTLVAIRVHDLPEPSAHCAIDIAFAEIAATHRAMSFHDPDSDVSRLNREAYCRPVPVSPHTRVVLRLALCFAEATDGVFDITTATELVRRGLLPRPGSSFHPDPEASWRDIEFGSDGTVRFHRPLWIDLGGIAKGYAVDRAVVCLSRHGVHNCCVNAGGDLRVVGASPECISLRTGARQSPLEAVLELEDGSLASSGEYAADAASCAHLNGVSRRPVGCGAFACVIAESCAVADALTKPVLALGVRCDAALRRFGATAHLLGADGTWQHFGAHP
jgi:FAD:protein FMN transferase